MNMNHKRFIRLSTFVVIVLWSIITLRNLSIATSYSFSDEEVESRTTTVVTSIPLPIEMVAAQSILIIPDERAARPKIGVRREQDKSSHLDFGSSESAKISKSKAAHNKRLPDRDGDSEVENLEISIPRRLIFTYKYNLLTRMEPEYLYKNVMNTIAKYKEAWNDQSVSVLFLDDSECLALVQQVVPRLVEPFQHETYGAYKADICRLVALYVYGGYYFDVDIEVINPLLPKPPSQNNGTSMSFITSWEVGRQSGFFQAILFTTARHPIIYEAIQSMIQDWYYNANVIKRFGNMWYNTSTPLGNQSLPFKETLFFTPAYQNALKKHLNLPGGLMGPFTLSKAYKYVVGGKEDSKKEHIEGGNAQRMFEMASPSSHWLLEEVDTSISLFRERYGRYLRTDTSWGCRYMAHDPKEFQVYFNSRVRGTPGCPFLRKPSTVNALPPQRITSYRKIYTPRPQEATSYVQRPRKVTSTRPRLWKVTSHPGRKTYAFLRGRRPPH